MDAQGETFSMTRAMSKAVITEYLLRIPLFADLSHEELLVLAQDARLLMFRKGARVFEEGSPADCCFVMTDGKARVVLSGDGGTEIVLATVLPGSVVGEVALLDRSRRSAALVAADACYFIRIPGDAFDRMRSNIVFERKLVAHVTALLRDANDQVRAIATFPSVARVVWCLGRIARQEGTWDGKLVIIPNKPHQELAEMSGCTRETISRAMSTLKRKKYVSTDRRSIRLDVDSLQRYVSLEFGLSFPQS
jgi:CRP/FNR family transcriptional regulator, cyclic AMP receptor protein